jgi:hypothetical protein
MHALGETEAGQKAGKKQAVQRVHDIPLAWPKSADNDKGEWGPAWPVMVVGFKPNRA